MVNSNRRLVLRDERTGHFLYGADYSTANGGFIGFIVFDELWSYDNATWMELTCHRNVIFCSGGLSDVSAVKIKMYPFLCLQD